MAMLSSMDVSIADAKNRLTPAKRRKVRLGSMRGRIRLLPGWDDPVDLDRFLAGGI